eukprot:TRINITY_DN4531_c0_g2_i1.p1 TRINITY_DN4531_c0_g2~~TRINITY_DN4531_c0_g2_i1.p1  ORF type:complete len:349 (+),score=71.06 TRINITY_DN4531_c0_g2_i1:59-1105(+)
MEGESDKKNELNRLELLPTGVAKGREYAQAAIASETSGMYDDAMILYAKAADRLLKAANSLLKSDLHGTGVMTTTRAQLLNMSTAYLRRVEDLKGRRQEEIKERAKEISIDDMEPNYYSSGDDEANAKNEEKQPAVGLQKTKRFGPSAWKLVAKKVKMMAQFSQISKDKPRRHCLITGKKFLKLKEISAAARPAVHSLFQLGQPHLVWCIHVTQRVPMVEIGRHYKTKLVKRTSCLSPGALYTSVEGELERCIPVRDFEELLISSDNWIAVRCPLQYDLLLQPTSTPIAHIKELIALCSKIFTYITGEELKVTRQKGIDYHREVKLAKPKGYVDPDFMNIKVDSFDPN